MKIRERFHALVTAFLVLYLMFPMLVALARTSADDLIGLGLPPEAAKFITEKLVNVNSTGNLVLPVATSKALSVAVGGTEKAAISSSGALTTSAGVTATTGNITATAGSFIASTSGQTLQLQEATAGAACMGTLTLTAATPVVTSTTCAKTASRIFLTRTSVDADTTGDMAVTAISDGVSFSVTSEASDTGTVNWLIINEAA